MKETIDCWTEDEVKKENRNYFLNPLTKNLKNVMTLVHNVK